MPFNESALINQIAAQERSISGVKASYDYAKNPDALTATMLPAVVHYIPSFVSEERGHFNLWKNTLTLQSIVFVLPREAQGGKLRFLENEVIPYGNKWRARFQDDDVITTLLQNVAGVKCFLRSGVYTAGGPLLTYNATEFLGWVMTFDAISA